MGFRQHFYCCYKVIKKNTHNAWGACVHKEVANIWKFLNWSQEAGRRRRCCVSFGLSENEKRVAMLRQKIKGDILFIRIRVCLIIIQCEKNHKFFVLIARQLTAIASVRVPPCTLNCIFYLWAWTLAFFFFCFRVI